MAVRSFQPLPPTSGLDASYSHWLDAIDRAQQCLDEAEKLFGEGAELAGQQKLGEAMRYLEAIQ